MATAIVAAMGFRGKNTTGPFKDFISGRRELHSRLKVWKTCVLLLDYARVYCVF